jgi:xanthine dehydrogenase YagS FAD-binding subunit
MAVALAALDAVVHVETKDGRRRIPIEDFYRLPGDEPERDTVLDPGSLVTAVELPAPSMAEHSTYRKVRDRASYAFAVASVAAAIEVVDEAVVDVRLALGAVAPVPWRAHRTEQTLRGAPATRASVRAAIDVELELARPLPDNRFKVALVRNLVVQTLSDLIGAPS